MENAKDNKNGSHPKSEDVTFRKKKVTLREVAEAAGVSVATVSMVLNGNANMRAGERTKQHVIEIARKLNYHPNINAQILRGKTSSIVGLIVPDVTNPVYPEMVRGVMDEAAKLGYHVILFNSDNSVEREEFFFSTLQSINAAGVIVSGVSIGVDKEDRLIERMYAHNMPIVLMDRLSDTVPSVVSENKKGAYSAITHLIESGHRHIAILVHYMDLWIMQERYQGYCDALADHGIPVDDKLLFSITAVNKDEMVKLVKKITKTRPQATAIFVASGDAAAIQLISAANECGVQIPKDLSVIGYDDIEYAKMLSPALATVWQPKHEMGVVSMQILDTMIQQEKTVQRTTVLTTQFIDRASVKNLHEE